MEGRRKSSTLRGRTSSMDGLPAATKGSVPPGTLPQDLIDGCRIAFQHLDHDHTGKIDVFELQSILEALGMRPTEEEMFHLISEVDVNMSGHVDFAQLLKILELQKERIDNMDDGSDLAAAFLACGGDADRGGCIDANVLIKIIKEDFGLSVDMEALIREVDADGSGEIEFEEFQELLS